MFTKKHIALINLAQGESGVVFQFEGGKGMSRRLEAIGVRVGKQVTKISDSFMRGPVTIRVGGTQVSMGCGMASKILIEVMQ